MIRRTTSALGTFSLVDPSLGFRIVSEDGHTHNTAGAQNEGGTEAAPPLLPAITVPEPASLGLAGIALAALFLRQRRGDAQGRRAL